MTSPLDIYIRSSDSIIATAANLTISAMASFKNGQLSATEYADVMHDILDLDKVTKLTSQMERQNEIANAFAHLKDIASAVSTLASL